MALQPQRHKLRDGRTFLLREAAYEDASAVLGHIEQISGESDFLTIGPGEFILSVEEEAEILRRYRETENQIYVIGLFSRSIRPAKNQDPHESEFAL